MKHREKQRNARNHTQWGKKTEKNRKIQTASKMDIQTNTHRQTDRNTEQQTYIQADTTKSRQAIIKDKETDCWGNRHTQKIDRESY